MVYERSLFIFRRDLRLEDNTALLHALANSKEVICAFIFDPLQITDKNKYKSPAAVQFLVESLQEVHAALEDKGSMLALFQGEPSAIVKNFPHDIDAVYVNKDYTKFSQDRDQAIKSVCEEKNIVFKSFHDLLLRPPEMVEKKGGGPYTVFTPYYRQAMTIPSPAPKKNTYTNFFQGQVQGSNHNILGDLLEKYANDDLFVSGGRSVALEILSHAKDYANYNNVRDFPALQATTGLSAHHKFGTISPRESLQTFNDALGVGNGLSRQLYWRDFFTQIAYFFPKVFGHAYQDKYNDVQWKDNDEWFKKWCEGKTGFPIVDAGMRELVATGYMHNRTRMIVASFLTKDLHISWQKGEQFFAQHLVDYDPCVNNGSWQWAASTGTDAQPYFRIFNPWLQQKRFDEECKYIKKWVPELEPLTPKQIHKLDSVHAPSSIKYPRPIVDHKEEKDITMAMFKSIQ